MKRFLKEMIGIMGLTMFVSSQSPVIAAEASSAKLLAETQISNVQTYAMPIRSHLSMVGVRMMMETSLISKAENWYKIRCLRLMEETIMALMKMEFCM